MTVEGMLYRMRVGCLWRDLPSAFGCWDFGHKRFNFWSAAGKWINVFNALLEEPDFEWAFIDGTYVKAYQHSAGAPSGQPEAIGKSRAGHMSKIHLAVDAHGLLVAFEITGGDINDCIAAPELIAQLPSAEEIVADKGYDSERIREQIETQGTRPVISIKLNSIRGNADLDMSLHCLVENAFARLKHFRAVAFRYVKLKQNYESMEAMACGVLWLPM